MRGNTAHRWSRPSRASATQIRETAAKGSGTLFLMPMSEFPIGTSFPKHNIASHGGVGPSHKAQEIEGAMDQPRIRHEEFDDAS